MYRSINTDIGHNTENAPVPPIYAADNVPHNAPR